MNFILWGILARAREQYDVSVCHMIFLGNHLHAILVVKNPEDVSNFMGYVKAESAHAINRLLNRTQRTVWQAGYDSPLLLTPKDVMKYICYLYQNPARANLTESINDYPGVSTWELFCTGVLTKVYKRLSRDSIKPLWNPALSINEQKTLVEHYQNEPGSEHEFVLEPNAWMECFPELEGVSADEINTMLRKEIAEEEKRLSRERRAANKYVIGATALRRQSMTKEYDPTTHGKRMICICHDRGLRKSCIEFFKDLCEEAYQVFESWKQGDLLKRIPPGMFAPRVPLLVSALSIF
jgi:REP element-mobilizing transposase RayT